MKAILERTTRTGRRQGIELTERDLNFIALAARWGCITADHHIRHEHPHAGWAGCYQGGEYQEWRTRKRRGVIRRMTRWGDLGSESLLSVARGPGAEPAFAATKRGGDWLGETLDTWTFQRITRMPHTWAVADIGMELERAGLTVYSEREFHSGWTITGEEVHGGPSETTRPALAITGQDSGRDDYLAVEVESDSGRGFAAYRKELRGYYEDQRCAAVWYCVDTASTGRRIKKAHQEMLDTQRDMPVRIYLMQEGHYGYRYLSGDPLHGDAATHDLGLIGARLGGDS